jgi:hypothetical protein
VAELALAAEAWGEVMVNAGMPESEIDATFLTVWRYRDRSYPLNVGEVIAAWDSHPNAYRKGKMVY